MNVEVGMHVIPFKVRSVTKVTHMLNAVQGISGIDVFNGEWILLIHTKGNKNTYRVSKRIMVDCLPNDATMRTVSLVGSDNVFKIVLERV